MFVKYLNKIISQIISIHIVLYRLKQQQIDINIKIDIPQKKIS